MSSDRWHRISHIYHAALARDESQRAAFLREACAGDEALRHEVASLLDQQGHAEGLLKPPRLRWRLTGWQRITASRSRAAPKAAACRARAPRGGSICAPRLSWATSAW